jgi:opacity protein-like surface antigen
MSSDDAESGRILFSISDYEREGYRAGANFDTNATQKCPSGVRASFSLQTQGESSGHEYAVGVYMLMKWNYARKKTRQELVEAKLLWRRVAKSHPFCA